MKPSIILCDIDGTVADISHRLHYISDEIKVGDIVRPVNCPNAKTYSGRVDLELRDNCSGVIWNDPIPPQYKRSEIINNSYIKKVKSWRKFFEACDKDTPIRTTIDIIKILSEKYPIVFMSGRPETYREQTQFWLIKTADMGSINLASVWGESLIMRPADDTREDFVVKRELYEKYVKDRYEIKVALDDRTQVVRLWRSLNIPCWQVAEGDF